MENPQTSQSLLKAKKRKLDEALHSLDEALQSHDQSDAQEDQPSPAKRPRFPGSLYSTLSKYGIKTLKEEKPAKNCYEDIVKEKAPLLSAIIQRTTQKARKVIPFRPPQISSVSPAPGSRPSASEYRPSSLSSFLARLATYQLTTYSNKPTAIDAVAASKHGWVNDGKDRLVCAICKSSWVVASRDGMSREAAYSLLEQQRIGLKDNHKDGCPWKIQHCDDGIYRVPLNSPSSMAKELRNKALALEEILSGVEIKHPLSHSQLASLMKTISETRSNSCSRLTDDGDSASAALSQEPSNSQADHLNPSEASVLVALLGWSIAPPQPLTSPPSSVSKGTSFSISRAGSPVSSRASSVAPSTPSISRIFSSRATTPSISVSAPMPLRPWSHRSMSSVSSIHRKGKERERDVLQCEMCQRRIGLWAFKSSTVASTGSVRERGNNSALPQLQTRTKPFDLLREHRPYCPHVVRSTSLPSLPSLSSQPLKQPALTSVLARSSSDSSITFSTQRNSPNDRTDCVEGWKAVLAVVLRSGLGRRQRVRSVGMLGMHLNRGQDGQELDEHDANDAEDEIQAMVDGVKANGGRELLRYVRGLFG